MAWIGAGGEKEGGKVDGVKVDAEKVRWGLECCLHNDHKNCPYDSDNPKDTVCMTKMLRDAHVLIRQQQERIKELEAAQTARVLTLEEAKTLNHNTVVWCDHKGAHPPRPRVVHYANDDHITFTDGSTWNFEMDGYGSHWRCWTQRPTDEQRKAVPWNERSSI